MIDPKHHFFHLDTNHSLHAPQQKLRKKKGEMLCKSVIDKNKTEQILTFSLIAMSEVCSIVCTFLHVQSTDYIHTYRHHFLFVLFLPFVDKPNTQRERERERPLVKLEIVERSGPKVSDSRSRSPAERSLSGNLNTNSFFNDFTEYDLRLSLPPPLPF